MAHITEGPWRVARADEAPEHGLIVVDKEGGSIADFVPPGPWMTMAEARANCLAASAIPDFMEAAALMTTAEQSGGDMWWRGFNKLKAAYKKAGGQFPSMDEVGSCRNGDRCVCGGDTEAVRHSCRNWIKD